MIEVREKEKRIIWNRCNKSWMNLYKVFEKGCNGNDCWENGKVGVKKGIFLFLMIGRGEIKKENEVENKDFEKKEKEGDNIS